MFDQLKASTSPNVTLLCTAFTAINTIFNNFCSDERDCQSSFNSVSNSTVVRQSVPRYPVTNGGFDLTTRHDLILNVVEVLPQTKTTLSCNYLSRECGLYKASDLLLKDHVCEKSDAVNWIGCPRISIICLCHADELQPERNNQPQCIFNHSIVVQSNLFKCCS